VTFRLQYAAISDVGRVRKNNQDSGYAGPWLLTVCDGVGGAARGDLASSTAIGQLKLLDKPTDDIDDDGRIELVAGALHRASDRIGALVDEEPSLAGTSTTATVGLFDGHKLTMGHIGDSRAYLFREGKIRQLTSDHTFVQSLIDEGRITEVESRTHPHRNLILKALDGVHELDPDLFTVDLEQADRLLFCSDGASGSLDDGRLADILSMGSPDFAAVELVRASLEAGSTDNVTCIVADVLTVDVAEGAEAPEPLAPMVVGSAAELKRRGRGGGAAALGLFRGHRAGDTGELEPVQAELLDELPPGVPFAIPSDPDPNLDAETARYAPLAPRRFVWVRRGLAVAGIAGLAWVAGALAWSWTQHQYYVGDQDGVVTIYRGIDAKVPGFDLSHPYETTNVKLTDLADFQARLVQDGIGAGSLSDAERSVQRLAAHQSPKAGG
jgi:PPM family protein phosphatase